MVYRNNIVAMIIVVALSAWLFVSYPSWRDRLLLNIGLIYWSNEVTAGQPPGTSIELLNRVPEQTSVTRDWALGSAYWLANMREEANLVWDDIDVGQRMRPIAETYSGMGDDSVGPKEALLKLETLGCAASLEHDKGAAAAALGDHETAIAHYLRAIDMQHGRCDWWGRSDSYTGLGLIHQRDIYPPEWDVALEHYRRALELDEFSTVENKAETLFRTGEIGVVLGRLESHQAVEIMQKVIEWNPEHIWAYSYLGEAIFARDGDLERAVNFVLEAIHRQPRNAYLYVALGRIYQSAGETDAAIEAYRKALEIMPDLSEAAERLQALNGGL